jgi:AcrR family transcriptional regulator
LTKPTRQNKVGQVMRTKGIETRRRIIDQTIEMLRDSPGGDISSADVARAVGLTPPALYLYFEGVQDVVLARLEEIKAEEHPYLDLLDKPWSEDQLTEDALAFLHAYAEYWRANNEVLRYRNMMSERRDPRFMTLRVEMTRPIAEHLKSRMVKAKKLGQIPRHIDPGSAAEAVLSLIDHTLSTIGAPFGSWGTVTWTRKGVFDVIVLMITSLIKGDIAADENADKASREAPKPPRRTRARATAVS